MLSVKNLRKSYGSRNAVDNVSFEIAAGETLGLLGPNGAGKSTIIGMIVGILSPDAGDVRLRGGLVPSDPQARRLIGVAPQQLSLYEELTAEENLRFFGRLYDLPGVTLKDRVNWALELAGLVNRRKDTVGKYSGGMKRRLNLACALVHDPEVVLLDEPTVGVDPQSRNHLFECIEALKRQGRTVLYTTHYMEEAERLCDRVAILDHGRLLAIDSVSGLVSAHGHVSFVDVEFRDPPPEGTALNGQLEGRRLRLESHKPLEAVAQVASLGLPIATLSIRQPDLEAVFLKLTGKSLRD
ncbi:MAG TPA: ABC transporter ATP-binding protein [Pirellulaceae bacterium]